MRPGAIIWLQRSGVDAQHAPGSGDMRSSCVLAVPTAAGFVPSAHRCFTIGRSSPGRRRVMIARQAGTAR